MNSVREWLKKWSDGRLIAGFRVRRALHRKGRRSETKLQWDTLEKLFHQEFRRRGLQIPA